MEYSTHLYGNMSWQDLLRHIQSLKNQIEKGLSLGSIITGIKTYLISSFPVFTETFTAIEDDYKLMMQYLLTGMNDPSRDELYFHLISRTCKLLANIELNVQLHHSSNIIALLGSDVKEIDINDIRSKMEGYVTDVAMLSLAPADQRSEKLKQLANAHQEFLSSVFLHIVGSAQWSHELASDMLSLILSPTIDSIDAQLLVSAIMMSSLFVMDAEKILALMSIYEQTQNEKLRQRALVGWAFCLDKESLSAIPALNQKLNDLLNREEVRDDLLELQMQIVYCQNAERDEERIRKEVMPTLLNGQSYEITKFGIKEKDDDTLEDILHPDNDERKMEELESGIQKMVDMQRQGADIYFGGFSKMKRFSFFNTLANWFMPFYSDHPLLQNNSSEFMDSSYMRKMFEKGPFCDSDKYSFVLGLSSVFNQLPANVREMLKNGEATLGIVGNDGVTDTTPAYYRRLYLQDLYRFFKLNDYRQCFHNPFETKEGHMLLAGKVYIPFLHHQAVRLVRFLYQKQMYAEAKSLLMLYYDNLNVQDIGLRALIAMKQGNYNEAAGLYQRAFEKDSSNELLLKGYAMSTFYSGDFDEAVQLFEQLLYNHPDNRKFKLNLAISYMNTNKESDGVKLLYELNYKFPSDANVKRALAWALLFTGQLAQASKLYDEIIVDDSVSAVDYLNAGYCTWFDKNVEAASKLFYEYLVKFKADKNLNDKDDIRCGEVLLNKFQDDILLLAKYGISEVEIRLMTDITTLLFHSNS